MFAHDKITEGIVPVDNFLVRPGTTIAEFKACFPNDVYFAYKDTLTVPGTMHNTINLDGTVFRLFRLKFRNNKVELIELMPVPESNFVPFTEAYDRETERLCRQWLDTEFDDEYDEEKNICKMPWGEIQIKYENDTANKSFRRYIRIAYAE